jgi:hypothetical protein
MDFPGRPEKIEPFFTFFDEVVTIKLSWLACEDRCPGINSKRKTTEASKIDFIRL